MRIPRARLAEQEGEHRRRRAQAKEKDRCLKGRSRFAVGRGKRESLMYPLQPDGIIYRLQYQRR